MHNDRAIIANKAMAAELQQPGPACCCIMEGHGDREDNHSMGQEP